MENYNLSDLMQPYEPEDEIIDGFRSAAADIMSTIEINPYTGRLRGKGEEAAMADLNSLAMGMSGPMMGQMMDPTMMPPEFLSGPPQVGMPPQPGMPDANIQDPMGGMQPDMMNNPGFNNTGI